MRQDQTLRDEMLTPAEAADVLRVHPVTLATWRANGTGPRWMKIGDRLRSPVRYRRADIEQYLRDRASH